MNTTLAFDVYGTLVDPFGMAKHLAHDLGANILEYFEGLVTADDARSFKPDPAVYSYARRVTGAWSSPFWLVSSNPWDVIGARSAGLSR
jgi:HAD superfamily hydrolase (TIGR01493 family)